MKRIDRCSLTRARIREYKATIDHSISHFNEWKSKRKSQLCRVALTRKEKKITAPTEI